MTTNGMAAAALTAFSASCGSEVGAPAAGRGRQPRKAFFPGGRYDIMGAVGMGIGRGGCGRTSRPPTQREKRGQ